MQPHDVGPGLFFRQRAHCLPVASRKPTDANQAAIFCLRRSSQAGAYDEIATVILRGRVIDRAELEANR